MPRSCRRAYRLAPEHPSPTPLEDCWDALRWIAEQWPSAPLIVGGDSAGGNLATVCALRARDRGGPELALQVLVYPITDHDMTTASYREHGEDPLLLLGAKDMAWFFDHYLPAGADRDDPEVSPLRAHDLSGPPGAIVVTDEYDPLRDEGLAYAERLRDAGVAVTQHHYEDTARALDVGARTSRDRTSMHAGVDQPSRGWKRRARASVARQCHFRSQAQAVPAGSPS